jgi:uncharacterized protein
LLPISANHKGQLIEDVDAVLRRVPRHQISAGNPDRCEIVASRQTPEVQTAEVQEDISPTIPHGRMHHHIPPSRTHIHNSVAYTAAASFCTHWTQGPVVLFNEPTQTIYDRIAPIPCPPYPAATFEGTGLEDRMVIDSHVHAGFSDTLLHSWDTFEDIHTTLQRMKKCGIDKAIVLPIGHDDFERHNRQTAEIVAGHADRLFGYAKVNQKLDAGRIEPLLREAFEHLGLVGLKIHGHPTREIMEVMNHYRKPILADVFGEVYALRYVAEQYPAVPIIIAHMGKFLGLDGAMRQNVLWLARTYPNIYFDTSSVCEHEWLERTVTEGLTHKMIFGSDGPGLHCGVELARIKVLDLPAEQESLVLGGTIARLLGL